MSYVDSLQKNNDAYLAAALKWLTLKLAGEAQRVGRSSPLEPTPVAPQGRKRRFFGSVEDVPKEPTASDPQDYPVTDAAINAAAAEMAAAEQVDPSPFLVMLSKRFGLSRFEQQILLLCEAMELDTRVAGWCARAQDDPSKPYPTFGLAMAILDDPSWEGLSPTRPLRALHLIEANRTDLRPLTACGFRGDERILNYIKGLNYMDPRLEPFVTPMCGTEGSLPASQEESVSSILATLDHFAASQVLPIVQLTGVGSAGKEQIACRVAEERRWQLFRLKSDVIPTSMDELETLAELWQRETFLLRAGLYVDAQGSDGKDLTYAETTVLDRFTSRCGGLVFIDTREIIHGLIEHSTLFDATSPTPMEQEDLWKDALGEDHANDCELLAGQFNLSPPAIRRIAERASVEPTRSGASPSDRLWELCLEETRPRLETLARRLELKAGWNDIVLPEPTEELLRQIAGQVRQRLRVYDEWGFRAKMNRGFGITVLFSGESGTGKTMAAEVLAKELRLDLYHIDLSAVVSKYVGETEKNLRRLFDAAEDGGAVLFFDEADALFGKRTEVKDSHDRYANIETSYLLQRMEAYRGLAILATNMKSAMDTAFMRRLRFVVDFPFPGPAQRREIWEKVFPESTPTEVLNYEFLAKPGLTGGTIRNIALNAAFLAADERTAEDPEAPVTMERIRRAARVEFTKLGRTMSDCDFKVPEKASAGNLRRGRRSGEAPGNRPAVEEAAEAPPAVESA